MPNEIPLFIGFAIFLCVMLSLDLGVFHRKAHAIKVKEALLWAGFWVSLAMLFCVGVYLWRGSKSALEFLTCYLIEESLSIDNLFVFLVIFSYFATPQAYRYKALFWGIIGAIVMRFIFIFAGVALIKKLHWLIYIFGAFLIFTGIRMAFKEEEVHPEKNVILKLFRKFMPITSDYEDGRFFVKRAGRIFATPLFVVILAIESSDLVFAVDSIPAALAISKDPFIIYTANIFAILGLRSIFFALAGIMEMFHYLHYGLSLILVFVGVKMIAGGFGLELPISVALGVVASIIFISIIASVIFKKAEKTLGDGNEK